jgi:hypothetical protein
LLDSIAWLFNIRGGDITHRPLALSFALVPGARQAHRCSSILPSSAAMCVAI